MDERLRPSQSGNSRRSPSSPGKRRMVDNEKGKIRLISRGMPDSDDEDQQTDVVITQVSRVAPSNPLANSPSPNRVLNLFGSRKRKTVEPNTGEQSVLVLPSPTTQIARQIDSIRLAGTPVSSGVKLPSIHPSNINTRDSSMDERSSRSPSLMEGTEPPIKDSTTSVSPIPAATMHVEVQETTMEKYLQRPQHGLNMKRTMDEEEGHGSRYHDDELDHPRPRRDKMVKYDDHVSSTTSSSTATTVDNSNSSTLPIRVSTIRSVSSSPTPEASLHSKEKPSTSSHTHTSYNIGSSSANQSVSSSPVKSSKISNFSISELLAKDDNRSKSPASSTIRPPIVQQPTTTSNLFPAIPPSFLNLYYQHWYMQMLSSMKRFQGDAVETDSGHPRVETRPSLAVTESNQTKSSSPRNSPVHSVSRGNTVIDSNNGASNRTGGGQVTPPTVLTNGGMVTGTTNSDDDGGEKSNSDSAEGSDQRQNALLQVSEAHLAILPDEDGDTPLHLSIIQENLPLTYYLVRLICGVRMNLDIANNLRQTPLHLSIITRQPMLTHLLVQSGASVNFPDRRGNTCVHLAAQRKNVNALQILSQATNPLPDFNSRNFAGLTPVHLATKEGSVDVLKFLFQMGANKNCADSCSGRTPLHYAVESQNLQMCNFLLESGCNVNSVTFSGNTPLHVAAGRRLKEIVAVLMAYGANPAIANGEGDFPTDLPASLLVGRHQLYYL